MSKQYKLEEIPVRWYSYVMLILAIILFSGIFQGRKDWLSVFDFTTLLGEFGKIAGVSLPRGSGGTGARDGFLFAFSLLPGVMLALGITSLVEGLGGIAAAQKLLTPILKPLLGIPGAGTVPLAVGLQSTDATALVVREFYENKIFNEKERIIFSAYHFSASATITNFFSSGVALFPVMLVAPATTLAVIFAFKIFGGNLMRLYLALEERKGKVGGSKQ